MELTGPIIRISPNDLHIIDADFYEQIYSRHGKWEKSKEYCQQFGNEDSVVFTQVSDQTQTTGSRTHHCCLDHAGTHNFSRHTTCIT